MELLARYSKKGVKKMVKKIQEFSEHMNNESNLLQGNDDMIDGTTQGNRDDKIEDLYIIPLRHSTLYQN